MLQFFGKINNILTPYFKRFFILNKLVFKSVEIPPISSFIYELAFVKIKIVLIQETCENKSFDLTFKENNSVKIRAINICTKSKEKNARNQDLNSQDVDFVVSDNNANGNNKIKTFINMYLTEQVNNRFIRPNEKKLFNNPLNEKILYISKDSSI